MTRASILSCLSLLAAANFALCANGLSAAEPDALAALREMAKADDSLDRMIGQTIMVGFSGQSEHDPGVKAVRDQLAKGMIGGVVLYPENISSARQLRLLTAYLANANSKLVPFIAVDQEGGRVQRLDRRTGHTHFPSAQSMAARYDADAGASAPHLRRDGEGTGGRRLQPQFRPRGRSQPQSVESGDRAAEAKLRRRRHDRHFARALLHHCASRGERCHRGQTLSGSRLELESTATRSLPDVSRSWQESELEPYVALAQDGLLDMVMVGHLYHPRFSDGDKLPSSLSASASKRFAPRAISGLAAWSSATTWRWARCAITIHSRIGW